MIRVLFIVALGLLTACTAPVVVAPGRPQAGLLARCLDMPEGVPGQTNESLAQGFLVNREGLRVCKGVVQAIQDNP